jgi:transketolase C-terminal domain/subunit
MKQQDFLLLGIDQIVNTYNFIRRKKPLTSFTIMAVVFDQGYQGLHSSFNNLGDFCSIARVPGFAITNSIDGEQIINSQLISPGFRIIGVSQRLSNEDILQVNKIYSNKESTIFQYTEGTDATIVCFNFSFPYGWELHKKLKERAINASLFSVNAATPIKWHEIIENVKDTRNLVVIDDSKSLNLSCYSLIKDVLDKYPLDNNILVKRELSENWLNPNHDKLEINYDEIVDRLIHKR